MVLVHKGSLIDLFGWWQIGTSHKTHVFSDSCPHQGFDLLIANPPRRPSCPKNFLPLRLHSDWKQHKVKEVEALFEFAFTFFHDDAFILLFIPKSKEVRK